MSVEWSVRVLRPFTIQKVLDRTQDRLSALLGRQVSRPAVLQSSSAAEQILSTPRPSVLTDVRDPVAWKADHDTVDFIVDLPEVEARAFVGLAAYVPLGDDPDSGPFVYVTSARSTGSYVLSIAVTIAAADCVGGMIVDDGGLLGDTRLVDGEELAQRLQPPRAGQPVGEAITLALQKTKLAGQ